MGKIFWQNILFYFSVFIDAFALGSYLSLASIFLLRNWSSDASNVGFLLMISGLFSGFGLGVLSYLGDKVNLVSTLILVMLFRGITISLLGLSNGSLIIVFSIFVLGFFSRISGPLFNSISMSFTDDFSDKTYIMARLRSFRNAGMGFGSIFSSVILFLDYRHTFLLAFIFLGSLILFSVFLLYIFDYRYDRGKNFSAVEGGQAASRCAVFCLICLTFLFAIFGIKAFFVSLALPIALSGPDAHAWLMPIAFFINALLVTFFQVPFSRLICNVGRSIWSFSLSGIISAFSCLLFVFFPLGTLFNSICFVILLVLLVSLSEILLTVSSHFLLLFISSGDTQTRFFSIFSFGFLGSTIIGPFIVGQVVSAGYIGWFFLFSAFMLFSLLTIFILFPLFNSFEKSGV